MQVVAATEVVDDYLESADHIAYQYSNLIQPNTLFLNIDRNSHKILNVSSNIQQWLGLSPTEALGLVLDDDLCLGMAAVLRDVEPRPIGQTYLFDQCFNTRDKIAVLARVTAAPTRLLVELEVRNHECDVCVDTGQLQRLLIESLQSLGRGDDIANLVEQTTSRLRALLGFERGMCYRFDAEYHGEVISEFTADPGVHRYLGLRFPARDIPRTARDMLCATPVRTTFDQSLDCHEIVPARDPETDDYIDLTQVRGRGAAGACRDFYLNMGIRSNYVLPLIVENRLWGLLAFHDQHPKRVSPIFDEQLRSVARCLSLALECNIRDTQERIRAKVMLTTQALSEVDATSDQWLKHVKTRLNELKDLIPCDGFILRLAGEVLISGSVPAASDCARLIDLLAQRAGGKPLASNRLELLDEALAPYRDLAAGAMAIPLAANQSDMAIWLRSSQRLAVHWAGDPNEQVTYDKLGRKRLGVRESFELWTRVTENTCLPWTEQELALATSTVNQLSLLALSWHAAQANHAKTQFLSCMSHEIRTPMTAILGYAHLLQEQCESSLTPTVNRQSCEYIGIIERNGQHLLAVIDDILNLAKIEAGKLTVERLPISMAELLRDVVTLMKVQADHKNLRLVLEFENAIPQTVESDPVRLRQILLNLLGNAFKFTERGQVTLRVGYDKAKQQLVFNVIDTGIGMTQTQVSRLFNAFAQADSSTTRRFGGSGLGLKISQRLAQLLGGDITVSSELGVGSDFLAWVHASCEPDGEMLRDPSDIEGCAEPVAGATASTKPPIKIRLTNLRILLLEDGEDNQRLLKHLLSKAGAKVTICVNGKQGIEAVTTDGDLDSPLRSPFPFDIILTDMQMPELDGYSTARMLRQKGCKQPIIALTAFAMQGNESECLAAGCDDYVSKPIHRDTLLAICDKWRPLPTDV